MLVWLQVLTAIATPIIAALVAWIAWQQWNTARQKLVLDLFDDRLEVYSKVLEAIRMIEGPGRPDRDAFTLLHEARDKAQFLFGTEVSEYIRRLISAAANLGLAVSKLESENDQSQDWPLWIYENMDYLSEARHFLPILFGPYMKMAQMLPEQKAASAPTQKEHAAQRKAAMEAAGKP